MRSVSTVGATSDNTMTEVALALAMAFFSIMVLTMVSMGAGGAPSASSHTLDLKKLMSLAPLVDETKGHQDATDTVAPKLSEIVIFDGARFLTAALQPLPASWNPGGGNPIVLAVPRSFSLVQTSDAQSQLLAAHGAVFSDRTLVVTMLDEQWQERMAASSGSRAGTASKGNQ